MRQDYIVPASCADADFRSMWAEFEWENKVSVRTGLTSLRSYLDFLLASTNMRCLTPLSALDGDCDFLAANLYAKSVFGEDALANLSIEKLADGSVSLFRRSAHSALNIYLDFWPHPHTQQDTGHSPQPWRQDHHGVKGCQGRARARRGRRRRPADRVNRRSSFRSNENTSFAR